MTDQQRLFADQYLLLNNGTKAAIAAGYSERSARSQASQLLAQEDIEAYIEAQRSLAMTKTGITVQKVLTEYARIAFFDIKEVYAVDGEMLNIHQMDEDTRRAIGSIKSSEEWGKDEDGKFVITGTIKEVKPNDKIRALDSISKHLGLFEKDNKQKAINVNVTVTEEEAARIKKSFDKEL